MLPNYLWLNLWKTTSVSHLDGSNQYPLHKPTSTSSWMFAVIEWHSVKVHGDTLILHLGATHLTLGEGWARSIDVKNVGFASDCCCKTNITFFPGAIILKICNELFFCLIGAFMFSLFAFSCHKYHRVLSLSYYKSMFNACKYRCQPSICFRWFQPAKWWYLERWLPIMQYKLLDCETDSHK